MIKNSLDRAPIYCGNAATPAAFTQRNTCREVTLVIEGRGWEAK